MFIAHLPAGYLLSRCLQRSLKTSKYLAVGLVASVLPDVDMLYFYLVDNRQTLHHEYWTHLPIFWLSVWIVLSIIAVLAKRREWLIVSTIFFANIFLHLILDTFVGGIAWLYPWSHESFELVTVPATHRFWVWSFVFHWSFVAELLLLTVAVLMMWRDAKGTGFSYEK